MSGRRLCEHTAFGRLTHVGYFPLAESLDLAAINPNVTVTVSSALGHARPRLALGDLAGLRPLNRFFVRSIEAAAAA